MPESLDKPTITRLLSELERKDRRRSVFGSAAAGRALGIVNSAVLLFGAAMQTGFGAVLDRGWSGELQAATRVYEASSYGLAFILFVAAGAAVALAALGLARTAAAGTATHHPD
jgi:hypothetical protein